MVKVGINGFGRIGRNVLRAALGNPNIDLNHNPLLIDWLWSQCRPGV